MAGRIAAQSVRATVFRAASIERLEDAQCLHRARRFHGAVYLCGYALECELKHSICKSRNSSTMGLREAKQVGHNLHELLARTQRLVELSQNQELYLAFEAVSSQWSTEMRYLGARGDERHSTRFLRDSQTVLLWLRERK
jgi:hypothetical protein